MTQLFTVSNISGLFLCAMVVAVVVLLMWLISKCESDRKPILQRLVVTSAKWYCPDYEKKAFVDVTKHVQSLVNQADRTLRVVAHQDCGLGDVCVRHGAGKKKGPRGKGHAKTLAIEYMCIFRNTVKVYQGEQVFIKCDCPHPETKLRKAQ